jgi:ubiquinone/menaquinone biosynthesis C-methylase UbiE
LNLSTPPPVDPLDRVKQGAKWLWSQGDYIRLATLLEAPAKELASACVTPGAKILDVGAGSGNFALAAARMGAVVTASDVTAHMVQLGRERSLAEGLDITWLEADAESLPFTEAFDVVASVFGAMFAPRPELVAAEMFRAARPGGVVAMANYGSGGYLGRLSDLIATYATAPPSALPSPFLWGEPDEVRRRLRGLASALMVEPRTLTFRFTSLEAWREEFANTNPPLMALKQMLPLAAFEGLIARAVALVDELNLARNGSVVLESSYLSVIARK